ncbi:Putative inner membrane protein [Candidatus Sumerlaea chitinivorans]|uniref:Inner membrane protein n=1 Tax=Sumerlaea chitinivorans TaxID=2250252 RepID=A0A2Z4Y3D1_SUMC1|nr:Putative inner membrane protein [Candidatus Sumerlaea chitinivorans]
MLTDTKRSEVGQRYGVAHYALALSSLVIALALVVTHLTHNGLWIDEIYTLHAIHLPWGEMVLERLKRGHLPLYFALMKAWIALAGTVNEVVLRLPSVAFWLFAVASYWPLARRVHRTETAALALTLFALNGLALRQAVEARMYDLVLLVAVWLARSYLTLLEKPHQRRWKNAFVLIALTGFFISSSLSFLLGALVYDAWRRRRSAPHLLRLLIVTWLMLAAVSVVPTLLHVSSRDRTEIAHVPPAALFLHLNTFFSGVLGVDDYYAHGPFLRVVVACGAILTVWLLWKLWNLRRSLPMPVEVAARVSLLPLAVMVATWLLDEATDLGIAVHGPARYLISLLPFASLLVAWLLEQACPTPKCLLVVHSMIALLLLCDAVGAMRIRVESPRELLQFRLANRYETGDAVVVVPDQAKEAVELYAPNARVEMTFDRALTDETTLRQKLLQFADRERLFLVWLHGKQSPAVQVADLLFGQGISSSPKSRRGERRIFLYYPRKALNQVSETLPTSASE